MFCRKYGSDQIVSLSSPAESIRQPKYDDQTVPKTFTQPDII